MPQIRINEAGRKICLPSGPFASARGGRVLVIFDWRDGPIEGIVRREDGDGCRYFKLFAERLESETLDDRLFALWVIQDSGSSILRDKFGENDQGGYVWPVSDGLGPVVSLWKRTKTTTFM
ncbi:hypothetical protein ACIBI8_19415 [Streptomyces sp. NPDC050529]|uniref:hypothetical protein n=1 Tax=unclassified Streptomyces TaxID=2593676 RepID=UPI002DD9A3A8|nr:hypothetical protein [Streptomyces sp. NBC_01022]WRZ82076.1 hypothetical protein OG316_18310 [Streptomyces sp. NBC_01022]